MSLNKEKIEDELSQLRAEIKAMSERTTKVPDETMNLSSIIRYFAEEWDRTNRTLSKITAKVMELEKMLADKEEVVQPAYEPALEVPMSALEAKILEFVQSKGMVCADDVKTMMNYKGRNAACSRLKKLEKEGWLEKFQLSHKVYYRYHAGKTTKTLIISPPQ